MRRPFRTFRSRSRNKKVRPLAEMEFVIYVDDSSPGNSTLLALLHGSGLRYRIQTKVNSVPDGIIRPRLEAPGGCFWTGEEAIKNIVAKLKP